MLVLSRQRDEISDVGNDIFIQVVDIRADKVRLGIHAPPHVTVNRREVSDAIAREEMAADRARQIAENDTEGK